MSQLLIRFFGITFSLVALPAMAIIAVIYYRKNRTKGGIYFSTGAIMTALGSMFNQLFPLRAFVDQSTGTISPMGQALTSSALIIHLLGFFIMVIAWGLITFTKEKRIV